MQHRSPARSRRLAHRPRRTRTLAPAAIDRPSAGEPISGPTFGVAGWTWPFEGERVRRVELLVDGEPATSARLTLRPDIHEALGRPEAVLSGFEATVELPGDAPSDETRLALRVHGLAGTVWTSSPWLLPWGPADEAPPPPAEAGGGDASQLASGAWPATAALDGPDRDWTRRRLGYDPAHVVVLVADALVGSGPAVAALDLLAERRPSLELLVPGVRSDSYIANLMQRATRATGLEDRVTVPFVPPPAEGWAAVADHVLDSSTPGAAGDDLATLVEALDAVCRAAR